jgi:acetoin utilization deacetylase AcuC-like enzyme
MLRTGVIKDDRFFAHKPGHTHPEHPQRLKSIYRMMEQEFKNDLICVAPQMASLEQLELVHTATYIKKVFKTADHNFTSLAPDTPASEKTYLSACLGVGGCISALNALVTGACDVCFSLVRPPGHHALPDRAGGFCIFNNVAITARYAMKTRGMKRILIIDWDVHHGNGVNDLFYDSREVLYFSTHDTFLYPYSGSLEETGTGEGEGYTVNIPLPREFQDEDFLHVYREICGPIFERYRPELILVCAGFDAHKNDPIGRWRMTERVFGRLTRVFLKFWEDIFRPPLLFVLEGGYDFRATTDSTREVLKALTQYREDAVVPDADPKQAEPLVEKARKVHETFGVWMD